ncbi:MAG: glutamine synthetase [Planctomycetes bacterium]|nr:glutamine synthetase [Planctomycetota bacterium]
MKTIAEYLNKKPENFTKSDLIRFIDKNNIRMLNFRYVGGDGKLKTLNFVVTDKAKLDLLLSAGERVDGSSLFPYIDAGSSDLYVIPRYKTAFINPFSAFPSIDIMCAYYTSKGIPLPNAPEQVVKNAHNSLKKATGLTMEAMGELEYYILYPKQALYPVNAQTGYHGSAPFTKWERLREEAVDIISKIGGMVKYSHAEVGHTTEGELEMEQQEIELIPSPVEDAADQVTLAKWVLRMLGYKYGVTVTFAPKILVGHAGSGLHIHTRLVKNGKNMMVANGELSETAMKAITGYLTLAPSLTAFGNTIPISYLRLVPHQEAPTNICWGDRNRSGLVRVPLGWRNSKNMAKDVNPEEKGSVNNFYQNQTVEFRCPDGSADIYLLLAGLTVAARHGLTMKDSLALADKLYVDVNIFSDKFKSIQKKLKGLPTSCAESADNLIADRKIYEADGVFSARVIEGTVSKLQSYRDRNLSEKLYGKKSEIQKLVEQYLHYA